LRKLPAYGSKEKIGSKKGLPVIKCSCGYEILLVPDVKVMSKAIDAHVEKHKQKVKDPYASNAEAERISDYLIAQVFKKASKA
jgi:hypothetical protein